MVLGCEFQTQIFQHEIFAIYSTLAVNTVQLVAQEKYCDLHQCQAEKEGEGVRQGVRLEQQQSSSGPQIMGVQMAYVIIQD